MCLFPSVEQLCQTPPFSPRHPDFDQDIHGETGDQTGNVDAGVEQCSMSMIVLHSLFILISNTHLLSFRALQRTETTCAGEAKMFQEIVLPDQCKYL